MAMDGLTLRATAAELSSLVNGKIDKVQQPEQDALLFTVRTALGNRRLLACIHAENGRVQLTSRAYDNPAQAPAFCMLLRRRLVGGRIEAVEQTGIDRVLTLHIRAKDELFDETVLRLIVELTGKYANVLLVDADGKIIDCMRRVSLSDTIHRALLPGFPYEAPASQNKKDPLLALEADFAALGDSLDARALTSAFDGLSKATAAALLSAAPSPRAMQALFQGLASDRYAPCVLFDENQCPQCVLPFLPRQTQNGVERTNTMSLALDSYYAARDTLVSLRRRDASLRRTLSVYLSRAENKCAAFEETVVSADKLDSLRIEGELILANLHASKVGAAELIAYDYFADPPSKRAIPLDPSLSAQENAKKRFKQYRKGKLAKQYAEAQLPELHAEIDYLQGQLENLARCESASELDEIREELESLGYVKRVQKKAAKSQKKPSEPLLFVSSDGIPIRVGKNNRQNDELTLRFAKSDDLFLHAKNIPGSHVIVSVSGEVPETTLREAAVLAATYSHAVNSDNVAVDYTLRRFVKKPSGARPGMVIYTTNRTLYVRPDAALVRRLRTQ